MSFRGVMKVLLWLAYVKRSNRYLSLFLCNLLLIIIKVAFLFVFSPCYCLLSYLSCSFTYDNYLSFAHIFQHIAKQRTPDLTADLMKRGKHFILIRNPLHTLVHWFYHIVNQWVWMTHSHLGLLPVLLCSET